MIFLEEETDLKKPEINVNDEDVKKKIHIPTAVESFASLSFSFGLLLFDLTMNFMKTKSFPKSIKNKKKKLQSS